MSSSRGKPVAFFTRHFPYKIQIRAVDKFKPPQGGYPGWQLKPEKIHNGSVSDRQLVHDPEGLQQKCPATVTTATASPLTREIHRLPP